jgi:hypothetical protein
VASGDHTAAEAARAWRAVTGLPTPSGWSVSCRAAPPAAGITNNCRRPCASSRRNAIVAPSGDQRGRCRAVGEALGGAAVGQRDEQAGR